MNISILGCGWLGLPLATYLTAHGHQVKGSTTSREKVTTLRSQNIEPFIIKLTPEIEDPNAVSNFWESDVLVLNIPSRTRGVDDPQYHLRQVQSAIKQVEDSSIQRIIFVSATSVYPPLPGVVTEDDAIPGKAGRDTANALLKAENELLKNSAFQTTVVRFGGLVGGGREPIKYLTGKKNLPRANAQVNLIHQDDCVAIIDQIITQNINGEVFNAVCDEHPTRADYYKQKADQLNLTPPTFKPDDDKPYREISNNKLKNRLGYTFKKSIL